MSYQVSFKERDLALYSNCPYIFNKFSVFRGLKKCIDFVLDDVVLGYEDVVVGLNKANI